MSNSSPKRGVGAIGSWLHNKVVDPFIQILSRGAEPKQLAFSTALGISLGLFPIVVIHSRGPVEIEMFMMCETLCNQEKGDVFLCGMAIAVLGSSVNAPTVMLANFVATPLELSLMVVFLRFGEFVAGGAHFPLTTDALKKVLTGEASTEIFRSILNALLGWLVLAPLIMGALYIILLPGFVILVHKFKFSTGSSPKLATSSSTELRLKVRDI